jgi:hypothetical protein
MRYSGEIEILARKDNQRVLKGYKVLLCIIGKGYWI